jgi:ABC-type uncharacterized transport system involved in gliding motility auxiliary subunit
MSQPASSRSERFSANLNLFLTTLIALVIVGLVNYLGFTYWWRKDLSGTGYYDLSPKTIAMVSSLKEPVRITTFLANSRIGAEVTNLLLEYKRIGRDKIILDKIDPAIDIDRADEAKKKFHFGDGENLVIFEYKDQSKYVEDSKLADYDVEGGMTMQQSAPRLLAFKGEQQFTSIIQALVEGKPAKIYFLEGHGERALDNSQSPAGLGLLAERIKRENIETAKINLATQPDIPADAQALVIAGPQSPLIPAELQTITNYLENKGKLVVLQDPGITSGLESVLQKYGIFLENNRIITKISMLGATGLAAIGIGTEFAAHPIVSPLKGINLQVNNARSVATVPSPDPSVASKVTILAKTPDTCWGETNLVERKPVYEPNTGDKLGPLGLAALYDGGEVPGDGVKVTGARLFVVGSSTFLTNQNLDTVSVDFFTGALNWMVKKDSPIGISPKTPREYAIKLSPLTLRSVAWITSGLVPLLALIVGISVWISRRK